MLRKIRVYLALLCFSFITLLFLDFTGTLHLWFGWLAKMQIVPAILAGNLVLIAVLFVLTVLFGRIYCSVICPLGVLQDSISKVSALRKGKKNRFSYSKAILWIRYGVLALFVAGLAAGITVIVVSLDPYAIFGRIAENLLAPLYRLGNSLLAILAESVNSYRFYVTDVWIKNGLVFGGAIAMLIIVGVMAWINGRIYCNSICPVGTMLGLISRFSIYKVGFNEEKCTKCGLCEKGCKASCIDSKNRSIDYSRCVTCFNCVENCKFGAITYTPSFSREKVKVSNDSLLNKEYAMDKENAKGIERASFLAILGSFTVANTIQAQQLQVDGGLADIIDKKIPDRQTPIVPPGAEGSDNMKRRCVACQLCVSACPNNVLRPSGKLSTFMQPEMSFERGYCRPECVECSMVCPSGAIKEITAADKSAISIGHAVWIKENCVVYTEELACTTCERHCPTKAITLVPVNPESTQQQGPQMGFPGMSRRPVLRYPVVNKELCIGCGACEYLCPARPFSALYVEGNVRHHTV
jgi:ferredoxin